jgi:putative ABC transport system permease protein
VTEGRWWNESDDERHASVMCGPDTAEELFPNGGALGKEINIDGQLFTVIGVAEKRKSAFAGGNNPEDNIVLFPLTTFRKLHRIEVTIGSASKPRRTWTCRRRKMKCANSRGAGAGSPQEAPDNFAIFTQESFTDFWNQITGAVFIFMFAVSSVGLIVGGVGVMNIMLVSVTERTREIGVRKAIGARKADILMQFTLEAVTLTAVGGIIGIFVGAVITWVIPAIWSSMPARMSFFWTAFGFSAAAAEGLLFGIYPAWKAANLDPIESLRYE